MYAAMSTAHLAQVAALPVCSDSALSCQAAWQHTALHVHIKPESL
jgi:hypothetical protein